LHHRGDVAVGSVLSGSARPDLTVGLEAFQYHFPLGFIPPEVSEDLFLIRIILTDPLKTTFHEALYVVWIKGQPKVEDLSVVAVVVADGCPNSEAFFTSPTG